MSTTRPGVTAEMRRQMRGEYTITFDQVLEALAESAADALKGERYMVTIHGERIEADMAPGRMVAACLWSGDPWGEPAHPRFEAIVLERLVELQDTGVLSAASSAEQTASPSLTSATGGTGSGRTCPHERDDDRVDRRHLEPRHGLQQSLTRLRALLRRDARQTAAPHGPSTATPSCPGHRRTPPRT